MVFDLACDRQKKGHGLDSRATGPFCAEHLVVNVLSRQGYICHFADILKLRAVVVQVSHGLPGWTPLWLVGQSARGT